MTTAADAPNKYLLKNEDADTEEDEAARQRGRKRILFVAGAVCLALAVVGVSIGVGVGLGKRHDKDKASPHAGTVAPTGNAPAGNASSVQALKYLPEPGSSEAQELQRSGSALAKQMYQLADDAQLITTDKAVAFLSYFDSIANLTGRGVDVAWYQDQAYFLRGWFQARGYSAAMQLLRGFARGQPPAPAEVAQAVEQLFAILNSTADFQAFRSWSSDKAGEPVTDTQLARRDEEDNRMVATSNTLLAPSSPAKVDPVTASRRPKGLLVNPYLQYTNVIDPQGWMNDPAMLGYPKFEPIVIPIVFHVLLFRDEQGYLMPPNTYRSGSKPGAYIVDVMNRAYRSANIQFRLDEWRNNPTDYPYLDLGSVNAWLSCAQRGEDCTCRLAAKYNKDARQYMNVWVAGSEHYGGDLTDNLDIGYCTRIPNVIDTCSQDPPGLTTSSEVTRHIWLLWDQVDPAYQNTVEAFDDGAMTLVHEAGHYLGLMHTHQGDCGDKDGIKDTPANLNALDQVFMKALGGLCRTVWRNRKKQVAFDQVKGMNTCNGDEYIDNIVNYMSYVPSECYMLFTSEQVKRMQRVIQFVYKRFVVPGTSGAPNSRVPPKRKTPKVKKPKAKKPKAKKPSKPATKPKPPAKQPPNTTPPKAPPAQGASPSKTTAPAGRR